MTTRNLKRTRTVHADSIVIMERQTCVKHHKNVDAVNELKPGARLM